MGSRPLRVNSTTRYNYYARLRNLGVIYTSEPVTESGEPREAVIWISYPDLRAA